MVLNYNDALRAIECVEIALQISSIHHVVIVDNKSTDDSFNLLTKKFHNKCDIIKSDYNGGYSYGNNYGIKHLIYKHNVDIIFISNPDVNFDDSIVNEIVIQLERGDYSIVTGVMKNYNGLIDRKAYWNLTTFIDDILDCSLIGRKVRKKYTPNGINTSFGIINVDVLPGSFFGISAQVLKECNYFDEGTFLYYEEDILSAKLKKAGYRAGLLTNYYFTHKHLPGSQHLKNHIIYLRSKWYYQVNYNKISKLQKILLVTSSIYSLVETAILFPIRQLILLFQRELIKYNE